MTWHLGWSVKPKDSLKNDVFSRQGLPFVNYLSLGLQAQTCHDLLFSVEGVIIYWPRTEVHVCSRANDSMIIHISINYKPKAKSIFLFFIFFN